MSDHRFKVGDTVHMRVSAGRMFASPRAFKVVATLPKEGRAPEYRIRNELEPHERVVTEDCLAR
ncbi:MAG: hypothetical protein WAW96_07700 [Alphaproteobacteria bacterium]